MKNFIASDIILFSIEIINIQSMIAKIARKVNLYDF